MNAGRNIKQLARQTVEHTHMDSEGVTERLDMYIHTQGTYKLAEIP